MRRSSPFAAGPHCVMRGLGELEKFFFFRAERNGGFQLIANVAIRLPSRGCAIGNGARKSR